MPLTPHLFIAKWKRSQLSEMSAYQQHFLDLCEVLGEPKPADVDPDGTWYTFQKGLTTTDDTKAGPTSGSANVSAGNTTASTKTSKPPTNNS